MLTAEASEQSQSAYLRAALRWLKDEGIPFFIFEAFDEPWKGGTSEHEPEKHWGVFSEDRTPKKVIGELREWL